MLFRSISAFGERLLDPVTGELNRSLLATCVFGSEELLGRLKQIELPHIQRLRGISQYPTIGDEVHLVSENDLKRIYGQIEKPYFVKVGHIAGAESIPALIDVNKLITRHSAIVGTTGSGKSTTVAGILSALSDPNKYPSSRLLRSEERRVGKECRSRWSPYH